MVTVVIVIGEGICGHWHHIASIWTRVGETFLVTVDVKGSKMADQNLNDETHNDPPKENYTQVFKVSEKNGTLLKKCYNFI
jgi:hypothetical protein